MAMKILVAYYSRTGMTKRVAEALAQALGAELEPIRDGKNRQGVLGFILAGKEAALRQVPPLEAPTQSPAAYDLVVVGTPVWANTMSSPVRAWLTQHGNAIKAAAYFCTTAHTGRDKTLGEMAALACRPGRATLGLLEKEVKRDDYGEKLSRFISEIQQA